MTPNISYTSGSIVYRQGTDAQISLFLKDAGGVAIDTTNWSFRFVAKKDYSSSGTLIDLGVGTGITVIANEIKLTFSASCFTGSLREQSIAGVYQIDAVDGNGMTQVILDGAITVLKDLI